MLCYTDWLDLLFFFFNDTATTEIYTLSLHDALPILKSWIKAIREEPKFILNVLADAMKIVKMIAGKLNISVESEETAADEAEQVA